MEVRMLDITVEPIEIAPSAHHGRVRVRPGDHGTDVAGLYAIGGASGGMQGMRGLAGPLMPRPESAR